MANRVTPFTQIESLSGNILASTYFDNNIGPAFSALNDSSLGYSNYINTDTGSANNYLVSLPIGSPSGYNPGMLVTFLPANTNTGASSITVSPLTSVGVIRADGTPCSGGELIGGQIIALIFDGTNFRIISYQEPTGTVRLWVGTTAPPGTMLLNGTAISRTTYAPLFAICGTHFGAGDGSTTFNIPNMTAGRFPTFGATLGATGGSSTISISQLPAHSHTITDPTHVHPFAQLQSPISGFNMSGGSTVELNYSTSNTSAAATGITGTNNTGSGSAYSPLFLNFNWIVKT